MQNLLFSRQILKSNAKEIYTNVNEISTYLFLAINTERKSKKNRRNNRNKFLAYINPIKSEPIKTIKKDLWRFFSTNNRNHPK